MFDILTKQIAKEVGAKYGTKTQRAFLVEHQRAYEADGRVIEQHSYPNDKLAWEAHRRELEAAVANGTLSSHDGWTLAEWESDFQMKREAAKEHRRTLTKECLPVVEEISEAFAKDAEKFASEQAATEAAAYQRFGVPYPGPSQLVATIRKAADYARAKVPRSPFASAPPRDMLPYVDF